MDERALLTEMLHYDLWANRRWLPTLPKMADPDRAETIMRHILGCYRGWLPTAHKALDWPEPVWMAEDLEASLEEAHQGWLKVIQEGDLDAEWVWASRADQLNRRVPVRWLAMHVMNHASYHRGHLRGLAECQEFTDFLDTDMVYFADPERR